LLALSGVYYIKFAIGKSIAISIYLHLSFVFIENIGL